jgi:hypothetical protein
MSSFSGPPSQGTAQHCVLQSQKMEIEVALHREQLEPFDEHKVEISKADICNDFCQYVAAYGRCICMVGKRALLPNGNIIPSATLVLCHNRLFPSIIAKLEVQKSQEY